MELQGLSNNPSRWLRFYAGLRTRHRRFRQFLLVRIPYVLIILSTMGIALLLGIRSGGAHRYDVALSLTENLLPWLRYLLPPLVLIVLGIWFFLHTAQNFTAELYKLSGGAEAKIRQRISLRLWGWHGLFSSKSFLIVKDSELEPADHWSTWLGGPALLIINDGFAVYLERGNCFSRVVAGISNLGARETIRAVVDLRPQIREASVRAWTKDGIKVELNIRVEFQIVAGSAPTPSKTERVYPFDPLAVRKAVEYTAVRMREGKRCESDWREGTMGKATGLLAHHISSRRLDELFLKVNGNKPMLSPQVMQMLMDSLNRGLKKDVGVQLISMQITDIRIPPDVNRQRLDVWGAEKDSRITRIHGEAQAYEIRVREKARAQAQYDMIVSIAQGLKSVNSKDLPESLLLSLSGFLNQSLDDTYIRSYLANETLETLEKLRKVL
jgi:regulator of protease activity HflC (stomatin/prohibitin superfamily)